MDGSLPTATEVRERFRNLHQHQQDGTRSPHKPLLALYAVARVINGESSETPFSVAEAVLAPLIAEHTTSSRTSAAQSVAYPFTRLRFDGIWQLDSDVPMDLVGPLRAGDVTGRLEPGIEARLRADPELARRMARDLAMGYFSRGAARDVLHRVGLEPDEVLAPDRRRWITVELGDYLHMTLDKAREQFRELLRRQPVAAGRQVKFLPAETLLCLAAAYVVSPRKYGGANIDKVPSPVPELARLFSRSPASVLEKMRNLDGTRANGARLDAQVGAVLRDEQPRLEHVYRLLLAAARAEGIGPERLPDFLSVENGGTFTLLGQEELGPAEFEQLLTETEPSAEIPDADTERMATQAARVGQHIFASDVLRNCGHRCVFCGLQPSAFGGRRMLLAGHIKPWRVCANRERLDVRNGLAACPAHDVAFDTGLLSVDVDLQVRVAPALLAAVASDEMARHFYGSPPLREQLLLPAGAQVPKAEYLEWHRAHVFAQ
jgi:putative restriction endonuclease